MKRHIASSAKFATFSLFLLFVASVFDGTSITLGQEELLPDLGTRKQGEDWPVFLGPRGDSTSLEKGILTDWKSGLKVVWSQRLGQSYGIGAVSRGRYFQFDRLGRNARVLCMNAETGEKIWTREYETDYRDMYNYSNGPRCSPIVDGNRVYAFGPEGRLHCLDVADGTILWEVDTEKMFNVQQNFFGVGSNPVIHGDLLITMVGGSPSDFRAPQGALGGAKGDKSGIVAFDKFTGKVKYRVTDELASYASLKLAKIANRDWCFAFARGGLVGFEPQTGKVEFNYPWRSRILESVNASVPVVVGNEVFISETYGPGASLLRVKPGSGKVIWKDAETAREKTFQAHWNTPIHRNGFLYGSSGRHDYNAVLRCIDWKTGDVMWDKLGLTRTSLLYVDDHFVCQLETGELHLLKVNPNKYDEVARFTLRDADGDALLVEPCWAAPILSHGLMYVRGQDRVVCLELIPEKK